MQVLGDRATVAFGAEPDIPDWANQVALNPARVPAQVRGDADVRAAADRFGRYVEPGMARLAEMAGMSWP